jgi:hypothetical protein
MLWRNGCDGKALRYGAGERHQHASLAKRTEMGDGRKIYFIHITIIIQTDQL